jgi:hypothetical protein
MNFDKEIIHLNSFYVVICSLYTKHVFNLHKLR